jgi:hypothetical protein
MMEINEVKRGGWGGQLLSDACVDGISISNQMAKHRSAVSVFCRFQNVGSACNAGGSSSLHTRMNAAARLMQTMRCLSTDLKNSQRSLQHASNTQAQRTQALARQAQRTAQHARRCSRTCTLLTRPRVTCSITNSAQLHDMKVMRTLAGAVASRWQAVATQRNMRRTGKHEGFSTKTEPMGSSACCRRCLQRGNRCAKNHASALMSLSRRMMCARSCAGDSSLPWATRASDTRLPVR